MVNNQVKLGQEQFNTYPGWTGKVELDIRIKIKGEGSKLQSIPLDKRKQIGFGFKPCNKITTTVKVSNYMRMELLMSTLQYYKKSQIEQMERRQTPDKQIDK